MLLKKATIHKYKSFIHDQVIEIEDDVTCIVGKNESGKTAVLESLAKLKYFDDDSRFKFDETYDYPKNEWKTTENPSEQPILTVEYELEQSDKNALADFLGPGTCQFDRYSYTRKYNGGGNFSGVKIDIKKYIEYLTSTSDSTEEIKSIIKKANTLQEFKTKITELSPDSSILQKIEEIESEGYSWKNDPVGGYVAKKILRPNEPVFWYFDEYFTLPGRIDLNKVSTDSCDETFTEENLKISKALIELSRVDPTELINSDNYEAYISELEATSNAITDELFEYWKTNQHLEIKFDIETVPNPSNRALVQKYLNVRIRNTKHRVSLPLGNRSRGFIWFFSFLVWFSKIQADRSQKYIILLDEPGLNLHASAQGDLLRYVEEQLQTKYQVIYTTHSPFMIQPTQLHRVRTVYDTLDPKKGSVISDSIQEKDPDTLFPLQAALGYDIAQNLFISDNNLLVEGPGDLLYFEIVNDILKQKGKATLNSNITIVPVGGLDKVASFISLLRGSKLKIATILDTFTDQKGKKRIEDLIYHKIINEKALLFFDEFAANKNGVSDIEDMFSPEEYLGIYNKAFSDNPVKLADLNSTDEPIVKRIAEHLNIKRFNHYKPAIVLMRSGYTSDLFSNDTLSRFEKLFTKINQILA